MEVILSNFTLTCVLVVLLILQVHAKVTVADLLCAKKGGGGMFMALQALEGHVVLSTTQCTRESISTWDGSTRE